MTWYMRTPADANSNDAYLPKTTEEKAGCTTPDQVFATIINGPTPVAIDTVPTLSVPNVDTGGGGASYVAQAVHFNGSASLSCTALGATDNGKLSIIGWYKITTPSGSRYIAASDPSGVVGHTIYYSSSGTPSLALNITDIDGMYGYYISCPVTFETWHNIIISVDLNYASGSKKGRVYIDGVDVTDAIDDNYGAFVTPINGLPYWFGNSPAGAGGVYDVADWRIMPGVSLMDGAGSIPTATRDLFIVSGKPVDPAVATTALGTPAILFSGNASTFQTNQGTGGAFTLTGTLTNAGSHP